MMKTLCIKSIPAAEEYRCSKACGGGRTHNSYHQQLARLFNQALQRMEAVGADNFSG